MGIIGKCLYNCFGLFLLLYLNVIDNNGEEFLIGFLIKKVWEFKVREVKF